MTVTSAATLLASLDPLSYPERMRRIASEARRLAEPPESSGTPELPDPLGAVLAELSAGDVFGRGIGVTMACIAGRRDAVIAALSDPQYALRCRALRHCVGFDESMADDAVLATLPDAPAAWRAELVGAVRSHGREDLADRIMSTRRHLLSERDAARLLPACSRPLVERLLPDLAHSVVPWQRLAARHPESVLAFTAAQLDGLPRALRKDWWSRYGAGVATAAQTHPAQVLDLLDAHLPAGPVPQPLRGTVKVLARYDAARVLRLLTEPDRKRESALATLSRSTRARLARCGSPEVEVWARSLPNPQSLAELLRALPPSQRAALYDATVRDTAPERVAVTPAVLDALPRERRHAEARRMLKLPSVAGDEHSRLEATARLPWSEARPDLLTATHAADVDHRALAYRLLVHCAAASADPAVVTALLTEDLKWLRNEQDPVRRAALGALAAIGPHLFESATAEVLTGVMLDALDARDNSWQSRQALSGLACRILAHHALVPGSEPLLAWALAAFERLAGTIGTANLGRLDAVLRRGQERELLAVLTPWIRREAERGTHQLAISLAQSLRRRAWASAEIQDALADAARRGTSAVAQHAIPLWLADPAPRGQRVEELIHGDLSAVMLHTVQQVLGQQRTDLLDPYLLGAPIEGRFIASGTRWIPYFTSCAHWLPRQRSAYALLKAELAADTGATVHVRAAAIRQLASLPEDATTLLRHHAGSAEVPLAEAALGALAWTDDPAAALPLLLSHAGGDRARVAVYAAARAARFTPASAAAGALRAVLESPASKVTARKEALRIADAIALTEAADLLSDAWHADHQHRHVKAAAASRFVARLDDARALLILSDAVVEHRDIAVPLLRVNPLDLPEGHRPAYGALVAAAATADDHMVAAVALRGLPSWYPWCPAAAATVRAALLDFSARGDRQTAFAEAAMFDLPMAGMPVQQFISVLNELLDADTDADANDPSTASAGDRPARRRVSRLCQSLATAATDRLTLDGDTALLRTLQNASAEALVRRPGYLHLAAQLSAIALDPRADALELGAGLLRLADCVATRPLTAHTAAAHTAGHFDGEARLWNAESALAAVRELTARSDTAAGLIAVRIAGAAGPKLSWPAPWREVVMALREHPDPEIVELALDLDTAPR